MNKQKSKGLKHLDDSKAFTENSNGMIMFIKILKNII